jgi:hypothetical protein
VPARPGAVISCAMCTTRKIATRAWVEPGAKPILDNQGWFGFDLFSAFTYVYLMQLMFYLSGLFVWPSLVRKGGRLFLHDRLVRLGVPFLLGVLLLIPVALYPVYRIRRSIRACPPTGRIGRHCPSGQVDRSGFCGLCWRLTARLSCCTALLRARSNLSAGYRAGRLPVPAHICSLGNRFRAPLHSFGRRA